MRVVLLSAGAAGRYCGTCLHDNTLAAALVKRGEDVLLVPTYTPLRTDETSVSQSRVFFGGVNVYLQQKSWLFRHTPWFVDRFLDAPRLLKWLSKRSASVEVQKLGDLTVSTLKGEDGHQRKELSKLVRWLASDVKPDLVHLTNSMLVGMAPEIRRQLQVPIVCSLSGEDIFLEQLREPHYSDVRALMKARCGQVDAFIALNNYFADYMADYLAIGRQKIHVIRHGLNLQGHGMRQPPATTASREVVIGYFARVAVEKGLHHLAEAFILLCQDKELPPLRLRAAGYMSQGDEQYLKQVRERIAAAGLSERFEYLGELDRNAKIALLQSFDVMSVPSVYRESKGLSVIEGLANGVPMVLPSHGAFPELLADTGGGLLCEPENPASLAAGIKRLILDQALAERCGRSAFDAIRARYTDAQMAAATMDLYRQVADAYRSPKGSSTDPVSKPDQIRTPSAT